jgi:hypothetical protein
LYKRRRCACHPELKIEMATAAEMGCFWGMVERDKKLRHLAKIEGLRPDYLQVFCDCLFISLCTPQVRYSCKLNLSITAGARSVAFFGVDFWGKTFLDYSN